jgi:hypothetical protein
MKQMFLIYERLNIITTNYIGDLAKVKKILIIDY